MILGYEQYCGYLQYMRNYVVTGTGDNYSGHHLVALRKRLESGELIGVSWVDHFFVSDVYVLGLTLDFVEMHLWWLLAYRAREMRKKRAIHNRILFFVPQRYFEESKERFQLLESCGVVVRKLRYDSNNRLSYYGRALQIIAKSN